MKDNKTNLALIALTGISALIAMALVYFYVENRISLEKENFANMATQVEQITVPNSMTKVVVCKIDILSGDPLTTENLTTIDVNTTALDNIDVINNVNEVLGLKLNQPLYAGEWILKAKVASGNTTNCKLFLAEDSRAIRVMLNATHGLLGLVEPGDRVDVIAVLPGRNSKQISRTILQDISVLSVGNRCEPLKPPSEKEKVEEQGKTHNPNAPSKTFITLEVDPNQAAKLALAMDTGTIHLTLKNKADQSLTFCKTFGLENLVTSKPRPRKKKRKKKTIPKTITIINGDKIYKE